MIPSYLNGRMVDLENFQASDFNLENVAMSLSRINRFTGHTDAPYSVAQHAVVVSYLVPDWCAFVALHHDDAEAFIGDCPGPLKSHLTRFKQIEAKLESVIWDVLLGHQPSLDALDTVKNADAWALRLEQINRQLRSKFYDFEPGFCAHKFADVSTALDVLELWMSPDEAADLFLIRHHELAGVSRAA